MENKPRIAVDDYMGVNYHLIRDPRVECVNENAAKDMFITYQDVSEPFLSRVLAHKSAGIPTAVMQHGFAATVAYTAPTEAAPYQLPLLADKIMLWGSADRDRMIEAGYSESRLMVTGCPLFDAIDEPPAPKTNEGGKPNVLFIPTKTPGCSVPQNADILTALTAIKKLNVCVKASSAFHLGGNFLDLCKAPGVRLALTLPEHMEKHIQTMLDVFAWSDVVVLAYEGTPALYGYCMNKPTVFADVVPPQRSTASEGKGKNVCSNAALAVKNLGALEEAIDFCLNNPTHLEAERKAMALTGCNYGAPGKAIDRVVAAIISQIGEAQR